MVTLIHGSDRNAKEMRDAFIPWAAKNGVALLAPLFPAGLDSPVETNAYKFLDGATIRYDTVAIKIIEQFRNEYHLGSIPNALFGFSGGAQFAHRFAILHPELLCALSVGAPGNVTTLGVARSWWTGIGDVEQRFGKTSSMPRLRQLPVQAIVGSNDDGRYAISIDEDDQRWVPGANDAGLTRVERIDFMVQDWQHHGVEVISLHLPGVAHDFLPMVPHVCSFFESYFQGFRHDL